MNGVPSTPRTAGVSPGQDNESLLER